MISLIVYFLSIFEIIQIGKKHIFIDTILNVCLTMAACAQNTVKAKQVDTSCCSWETEKSFPIFAGNIYCLGYRHTLSFTLQLTTNKENENGKGKCTSFLHLGFQIKVKIGLSKSLKQM